MPSRRSSPPYRAIAAILCAAALASPLTRAQPAHPAPDARQSIALEPPERAMILLEMRQFLKGSERILRAAARGDMRAVADTARSLGKQATHAMPPALMQKLPQGFRTLGFSVHSDFDQLALDAESLGDPKVALTQLADILAKCNGCHESYRLAASADGDGRSGS